MNLYSKEQWWIKPASFLWDAVVHEVKRQHQYVTIERYGRTIENEELMKIKELLEFYAPYRDEHTGRISDEDLLKVAKKADPRNISAGAVREKGARVPHAHHTEEANRYRHRSSTSHIKGAPSGV
jgi:hypothetical protein